MANYIDGFVLPIRRDQLDDYKRLIEAVATVWLEHGALDYREYVGDDMRREGTRSFTDQVISAAADDDGDGDGDGDEVIVFGWVEFESRAARDSANDKVAADPRMAELVETSGSGFDAQRMAYGGFSLLARARAQTASP